MVQPLRRSCRRRSAPVAFTHQKSESEREIKRKRPSVKKEAKDAAIIPDKISSFSNSKVVKKENALPDHVSSATLTKSKKKALKKNTGSGSGSGIDVAGKVIRPTSEECEYVVPSLAKIHPSVVERNDDIRKTLLESCGMRDSVTDAIISTMLSQNTTDANSKAAFRTLKKTFPDWEDVATPENLMKVEDAIRVAGLAKTRAERMQAMLQTVKEERGVASLDYIRDIQSDDEIKKELSRFKGLGPKTISCVLLFALGRSEFPVDTHVLRISKKMGWIPDSSTRESAYDHLNSVVPSKLKMDLHCLLVHHGKYCHSCAANGRPQFPAKDGSKINCPLKHVAKWAGVIPSNTISRSDPTPKVKQEPSAPQTILPMKVEKVASNSQLPDVKVKV